MDRPLPSRRRKEKRSTLIEGVDRKLMGQNVGYAATGSI